MNTDDWFAAGLITAVAAYLAYDATRIWRNHRAHKRFVRDLNASNKNIAAYQAGRRASYEFLIEWLDVQNMSADDRHAFCTFRDELASDELENLIAGWTAAARAEDERRKGDQS